MLLKKYENACEAKNPLAITTTPLTEHLQQPATFIGHTSGVNKNNYILSDDDFSNIKISKLLNLMEKGSGGQFKGK